jgi:general secretion pathway protein K
MVILVMGLSYEARSDIERTRMHRDKAKAYWLARAAVERVKYDYAMLRLQPGNLQSGSYFRYNFQEGYAECTIKSQASLFPMNANNREVWDQLLKFYDLDEVQRAETIDAIIDWVDADDLIQINGAESEYYSALEPPYIPRNGPFHSVEEILLVRGISESMYFGYQAVDGFRPGLTEMLTTEAQNLGKFDIQTCSEGILRAFLEVTPEEAQSIIRARQETPFQNINEVVPYLVEGRVDLLEKYFMVFRAHRFTIRATAYINGSPARHTVEDEVQYTGNAELYVNLSHKDSSLDHVEPLAMGIPAERE